MADAVSLIKKMYQTLPLSMRRTRLAVGLKRWALRVLFPRSAAHAAVYDSDYYGRDVEPAAVRSAPLISESIVRDLKPRSVVDVGCGTGAMLKALRAQGCRVFGLEYSRAGLEYCASRKLNVMRFDLQRDVFDRSRTFDVAMSVEVAEHLPEEFADRFVNLLTQLAPTVVFTASPPGAGGTEHINEQPHSYWEEKFQQRNYRNDVEVVNRWRQNWKDSGLVASCYYKNIMLFRKLSAD